MSSKVDCKVVLLGKSNSGKTCLTERYLQGKFKDGTAITVGVVFTAKKVEVGKRSVTLGVWDTAGSERYEAMSRIYYRDAKAALICYDLTDSASFQKIQFWVDELRQNEENCLLYIVGTKYDLVESGQAKRQVD
eukprot:Colp12_sorted_trinity150504_noHs@35570